MYNSIISRHFRKLLTTIPLISYLILLLLIQDVSAQEVYAKNGMVASAHPLATKAGIEILKNGGNAVDAAVATAFALAVVEPNASGLGGGGFMVIKMANIAESVTIDYRETAPSTAKAERFYNNQKSFYDLTHSGPYSIGVPGVLAGLALALERYGTMNLGDVTKPAIEYAREGYEISENFANMIIQAYDLISANAATSKIYLRDGLPSGSGETITNSDLANTLEKISTGGIKCFYQGEIGSSIVKQIKSEGGILNLDDLKRYKAIAKKPVQGTYRGYQIISSSPPTGGGTHLIELLNILEGYDLNKMKPNSPEYLHLLAETMKICLADKATNMADPAFYSVPVNRLTAKSYARDLRKFINPEKAFFNYKPKSMLSRESNSTTHLSVIDKDGNLIALTQSINLWFGSGITIDGTGIILNNHLADFFSEEGNPNSIEPFKRPVSSIAPTILLKDGKPFLTIGTPGGSRIIGALAQIIVNIIDFNMSIDQAIEAPRIHTWKSLLHVEGGIPEEVINELEKRGHRIKRHKESDNYFGGAQGILVDEKTDQLSGGADSRRDGVAIGY